MKTTGELLRVAARTICFVAGFFMISPAAVQAVETAAVVSTAPAGEFAEPARQIVIRFDKAIVPLGEMARDPGDVPISIEPAVNCQWRWIERSAIACQLSRDDHLELGTGYRIRVETGPLGPDGQRLAEPFESRFITRRPVVKWVNVGEWRGAGLPIFRVTFDQPVTRASAREHLFFEAGKDAGTELPRQPVRVAHDNQTGWAELRGEPADSAAVPAAPGDEPARRWLVTPGRSLPEDESIHLRVESGPLTKSASR